MPCDVGNDRIRKGVLQPHIRIRNGPLKNQIKDYYKVFSYVYVVVGNKQLPHVKEFLKDQKVGICELTTSGKLICRKKAFYNREDLSYDAMFQVLRKAEFESIILKHFHKLPAIPYEIEAVI